MSNEKITSPTPSNKILSPKLKEYNSTSRVEFKLSCLKQEKVTFTQKNVVIYLLSEKLDGWSQDLNVDFILQDCLFGAVKLSENVIQINFFIQAMVLDLILVHFSVSFFSYKL